jgi:hypothetical protein
MREYIGVMSDDVREKYPGAVSQDDRGFDMVNYDRLGIEMQEVQ